MRIDSCRKCGDELKINQRCNVCDDAIEFYCLGCGTPTENKIHPQCILIKSNPQILKVISKRS